MNDPAPHDAPHVILHIPHSSRVIPPEHREALLLADAELDAELLRMTDAFTDELFDARGTDLCSIVHPVSRLVVDPERFRNDAAEPMAARGMGAVYTRTAHGRALRGPVDSVVREALLATWYDPHHQRLARAVDRALASHSHCLIIDCHSFPSAPLPCDLAQASPRPDICIGTDPFHTPGTLVDAAVRYCGDRRWSVAVDRPYAGALVPGEWYRRDGRVASVMVELNRALYMDEATGHRLGTFAGVARDVQGLVLKIVEAFDRLPLR